MNRVEIPLSKGKLLLILLGGLLFVVFGIIFIVNPEKFISARMSSPELLRLLGIASFLFFGVLSAYALRKLFGDPIGLIIDEEGITDHTSASAVGLIKWDDITEVRVVQVKSTRFLLLYVANPGEYLDKAKGLKKMFMKGNHSMYGTPLSIASNTLQYKFNDLERLIAERLSSRRSSEQSSHL